MVICLERGADLHTAKPSSRYSDFWMCNKYISDQGPVTGFRLRSNSQYSHKVRENKQI